MAPVPVTLKRIEGVAFAIGVDAGHRSIELGRPRCTHTPGPVLMLAVNPSAHSTVGARAGPIRATVLVGDTAVQRLLVHHNS